MAYTLPQLVDLARSQDANFDKQMNYWLERRKKTPDFDWLMKQLGYVLGHGFLTANAQELQGETDDNGN